MSDLEKMSDFEKIKNDVSDVVGRYIFNYKCNLYREYKIICKEDMLYPQYSREFTTIDEDEFKLLQKKAAELLAGSREKASPHVVKHWISIINGVVPFGYTLNYNEESQELEKDDN